MSVHFFFLTSISPYEFPLKKARGLEVVLFIALKVGEIVGETGILEFRLEEIDFIKEQDHRSSLKPFGVADLLKYHE
jgi:hypothetical protein